MSKLSESKLSEKEYWDDTYQSVHEDSVQLDGFRNFSSKRIFDSIAQLDLENKKILEIGAGDSQWLPFLATQYPTAELTGLDYSEIGCKRLSEKAERLGLDIEVIQGDLFEPPAQCVEAYDVILSFGVVEHFDELDKVMRGIGRFLKPDGRIYTIIPNMSGLLGTLTKAYDVEVYNIHNPHTLESMLHGHTQAELTVESSDFVCSNNFSVLSSCVDLTNTSKKYWFKRFSYVWLSRLTSLLWMFESRFFELPKTRLLSPYIYCITRKNKP